jgi:hypothetical protein
MGELADKIKRWRAFRDPANTLCERCGIPKTTCVRPNGKYCLGRVPAGGGVVRPDWHRWGSLNLREF